MTDQDGDSRGLPVITDPKQLVDRITSVVSERWLYLQDGQQIEIGIIRQKRFTIKICKLEAQPPILSFTYNGMMLAATDTTYSVQIPDRHWIKSAVCNVFSHRFEQLFKPQPVAAVSPQSVAPPPSLQAGA